MKERQGKFSVASIARLAQIPEDFTKGSVLVSLEGQERLVIENFKGISSYTLQEIRLLTRKKKICISGSNLRIESYTREEIEISGSIQKLEFL